MDPDLTLAEIQTLTAAHQRGEWIDVDRLVELIDALDNWLIRGGFPPEQWRRHVSP